MPTNEQKVAWISNAMEGRDNAYKTYGPSSGRNQR